MRVSTGATSISGDDEQLTQGPVAGFRRHGLDWQRLCTQLLGRPAIMLAAGAALSRASSSGVLQSMSPVVISATGTAGPTVSAGRFSPRGLSGIIVLLAADKVKALPRQIGQLVGVGDLDVVKGSPRTVTQWQLRSARIDARGPLPFAPEEHRDVHWSASVLCALQQGP